tara:strand:+ start:92 stop:859 length:768 start_codon:yes stop_codon:yes gene_type:complete
MGNMFSTGRAAPRKKKTLVFTVIALIALLLIAFQKIRISCNPERSSKPSLAYIIRGPLFDPRRVPENFIYSNMPKKEYKIDTRELWSKHEEMIKTLSKLYEVNVIFSTYDNTPLDVKLWASNRGKLLISKRQDSKQFTTALTALKIERGYDYYFITRSDLEYLPAIYSIVSIYPKNVTVLNLESGGKLNDIIHFLPQSKYDEFYQFIEDTIHDKNKRGTAHSKPEGMTVDVLTSERVPWVRHKNKYYTIAGTMGG